MRDGERSPHSLPAQSQVLPAQPVEERSWGHGSEGRPLLVAGSRKGADASFCRLIWGCWWLGGTRPLGEKGPLLSVWG